MTREERAALITGKLDLVRRALQVAVQHVDILRDGVSIDDVDAMTRGRSGYRNAVELCDDLMLEVWHEMPDWRPEPAARLCPDAHLGAAESAQLPGDLSGKWPVES